MKLRWHAFVVQALSYLELTGGSRLIALLLHGHFKTIRIHGYTALAANIGSQIQRKTKCVM